MRMHPQRGSLVRWRLWPALAALGVVPALAQEPPASLLTQQRQIDDRLQQERLERAPLSETLDWQYGGWVDYFSFMIDDGIQSQRLYQRPGVALWSRVRLDNGAHELFARVRLRYNYYNPGDEYERQRDWEGPDFDRAWYQVDIGRALRLTRPSDWLQMKARLGRQEVLFGTGFALDQPLDAAWLETTLGDWRVDGLFGRSPQSYLNVDRSTPVSSHSSRRFFGVQVAYTGIERHEPFAYAIWNDDATDETPRDRFQNYAYDTQYFGFGSRGQVLPRLQYWAEAVFETGRSYGDGAFLSRDYVQAYGWDVGLEYLFAGPMRKRLMLEYMFGSGDPDRVFNATGAAGGNRGGGKDSSLVTFGFRDTGMAAALATSNLHIWKAGGSLTPLESIRPFEQLEVGSNWFLYHKHHARAAISDGTADEFAGYVGWEMDYFINWRFASDVSWTIRWGLFFPGDAYSDQGTRNFLFSGITWSF